MKLIIASAILAVCTGSPIDSLYIPSVIQPDLFNLGSYHEQPEQHEHQEQHVHHRANSDVDKNAAIVKYDSESHGDSYHYDFETSNGIRTEQSGAGVKGSLMQGGFSYTGDDGKQYTVTYSADEHGYRPRGDHLPTPPPTPEAILRALEQNEKDEAAGISDDGSYTGGKYEDHGSSDLLLGHGPSIHDSISSGYVY